MHKRCAAATVDFSETPLKDGAPILKVHEPWFSMLLNGEKTWEIRGVPCHKEPGATGAPHARCACPRPSLTCSASALATVHLEKIGDTEKVLRGAVDFQASIGPLSISQWMSGREQHCIDSDELPYGERTYAWQFVRPRWFVEPKESCSGSGQVWAKQHATDKDHDGEPQE